MKNIDFSKFKDYQKYDNFKKIIKKEFLIINTLRNKDLVTISVFHFLFRSFQDKLTIIIKLVECFHKSIRIYNYWFPLYVAK